MREKMVENTLVIGDVHGRRQKLWEVLVKAGAVDPVTKERVEGFRVVQLGDLVSLGYDEVEAEFYQWALGYIDETLAGNHELPVWWFNSRHTHLGWDADRFHGWHVGRDREAESLVRRRYMAGGYSAASSVGPWLLTHAGVAPRWLRSSAYGLAGLTAADAASRINELFYEAIETRTNMALLQGPESMFWIRIHELQNGYGSSKLHLPQVVGHSPSERYSPKEVVPDRLWCIDSPPVHHRIHGGVVGLLFRGDNARPELLYVE